MDRSRIRTAIQLLAKAESTESDAEASALIERSYRLLADVITKHDLERGETIFGPRRRERRFLRDRRGKANRPAPPTSDKVVVVDPVAQYRRTTEPATDAAHIVDLNM
jgi:hypothetical protein